MNKKNTTTHQHTTPECYLKKFSENKSHIYYKWKKVNTDKQARNYELKKPVAIKSATVVDDFYTIKNAKDPLLVEDLIYNRQIENKYHKIYKLLTDETNIGISQSNRIDILLCFLSLHCRTPKQFNLFFETVKDEITHEVELVKEDYKVVHARDVLTNFIAAHEFQDIQIWTITDSSEFLTSDNPVLIVDDKGVLKNHIYREQFNMDNSIIIPINPKQCIFFFNGRGDKNKGIFHNRIYRRNIDCCTVQNVNFLVMGSADKLIFGTKKYLNAFFSFWNFT